MSWLISWLPLSTVASYLWTIRRLPGGMYGLLMVWTGIYSLAHQYFTNSFISSQSWPGTCLFDQGIVTTSNNNSLLPATSWDVSVLAYNAYLAAKSNSGKMGVYDKINWDVHNFQPQDRDILGYWNCTQQANGTISPADWSSEQELQAYITNQSFIYQNLVFSGESFPNGSYGGFIAWSSSTNQSDQPWDVRAIVATDLEGDTPQLTFAYQCAIVRTRSTWLPPLMPPYQTLYEWNDYAYAVVRDAPQANYGTNLQNLLNAMTMISGSGNSVNQTLSPDANPNYSCIVYGTKVGPEVFILLATLIIVLLLLLCADLYAAIIYRLNKNHERVKDIPTDYIAWQLTAVQNALNNSKITMEDMKHCEFGWSEEKHAMEYVKATPEVGIIPRELDVVLLLT